MANGWAPVTPRGPAPQPLARLATVVVVLTAAALVAQVVQLALLRRFTSFGAGTADLGHSLRQLAITLPFAMLGLAQTIVALVWMYRASSNVTLFGMRGRTWGPGWAVGSWFIPLANMVLPLFALNEIWKGSEPGAEPETWRSAAFPPLLGALWAFWVGNQLIGLVAVGWTGLRNALAGPGGASQVPLPLSIVQAVLYVIAGVLFLVFVRQVSSRQDARMWGMPELPVNP